MKRFLAYGLGFLIGGAVGAAVTYKYTCKKLTELHDAEIDELRKHYLKTADREAPKTDNNEEIDGGDTMKYNDPALKATSKPVHPHPKELDEELQYIETRPTEKEEAEDDWDDYYPGKLSAEEMAKLLEDSKKEAEADFYLWKYNPLDPHCDDEPFESRVGPMRSELMGEGDNYEVVSVDWYEESGIMTDEMGNVIPEALWDKVMGQDWKCAFAYYDEDVAVVHNQYLNIDYEISKVLGEPPELDVIQRELTPLPSEKFVDPYYDKHPRTYRSKFAEEYWPEEWRQNEEG